MNSHALNPLKAGTTLHRQGNRSPYIRIKAGPWRDLYLHRIIADILWRQKYDEPLPHDKDVHHMDGNPLHCCPTNLLILDPALHNGHQNYGRRRK